jgi:D-xylose transport system substrate-binding protein
MKKITFKISVVAFVTASVLSTLLMLSAFRPAEKIKIGFLVHDLVSDRWKSDIENFSKKITELGGEPVTKNAFGDVNEQIKQGKAMVDEGVKVIAVVAQDGKALAELVDYANKKGTTIIGYDRMILNCDLPYYISFNSIKVGEMMTEYALKLKPKGNYIILNGPSSDNNALLIRQGVMNKLKGPIEKKSVNILLDKEMDSWHALSVLMAMEEFLPVNKQRIDVIIAASDDLASGALDAIKVDKVALPIITGQNATVDACRNIMHDFQTMTVYKDFKKLSSEAAIMAMKIAKGEKTTTASTTNNGKINVPSILFDPVVIDKSNLRSVLIPAGHVKESDLN